MNDAVPDLSEYSSKTDILIKILVTLRKDLLKEIHEIDAIKDKTLNESISALKDAFYRKGKMDAFKMIEDLLRN
jgi:hypothetical protein